MNTPLIPVTPGQLDCRTVQLVDARLSHAFLEVGRDFSNWIKGRIAEYGFEAGLDYRLIDSPNLANQSGRGGNRRSIEYFLSLDMAKELAMVERTPRGRQARRYFLASERQLRQLQQAASSVQAHSVLLSRAERQAINRQAWADVAGLAYAEFHARREQLLLQAQGCFEDSTNYLPRRFRPAWAR